MKDIFPRTIIHWHPAPFHTATLRKYESIPKLFREYKCIWSLINCIKTTNVKPPHGELGE